MRKSIVTLAALLLAARPHTHALAQETKQQPAFTLHSRVGTRAR